MKRPSIHQLEVFCRIVQLESMARAAEELQVAPSSVSMQVQELERRYRTKLLIRGPRRTTPTPAGAALYKQVLALLQGLDAVEREIAQLQQVERGTLRFASSRTIGAGLVRRVLQAFEGAHPEVDISYSIMKSSQSAKTEVLEERAEFALVGRVGPGWPLEVKPLFQEAMVVAVAPGHPLAAEVRPDAAAPRPLRAAAARAARARTQAHPRHAGGGRRPPGDLRARQHRGGEVRGRRGPRGRRPAADHGGRRDRGRNAPGLRRRRLPPRTGRST